MVFLTLGPFLISTCSLTKPKGSKAGSRASIKPSPPSEMGIKEQVALGMALRNPILTAKQASLALSEPLKVSLT